MEAVLFGATGCGDEQFVAEEDGTGDASAWEAFFPSDAGFRERGGQFGFGRDAGAGGSSELEPVGGEGGGEGGEESCEGEAEGSHGSGGVSGRNEGLLFLGRLGFGGARGAVCGEDGSTGAVADAELELPFFGPVFHVGVLAEFDEEGIGAFVKGDVHSVLVDAGSSVVFVTAEEEFAVEPEFPTVLATEAQFCGAGDGAIEHGGGVSGDFFEFSEGFVQIDFSVVLSCGGFLPFDFGIFAVVFGVEAEFGLGWEGFIESGEVGVVEGADDFPVGEEAEMFGEIDVFTEGAEFGGDGVDLFLVACGIERGSERFDCLRFVGIRFESFGGFDEEFDGVVSEFDAGIVGEGGDEVRGFFGGDAEEDFVGEASSARVIFGVGEEGVEFASGDGGVGGEGSVDDGVDGGAEIVGGEVVCFADGGEEFGDSGGGRF